MPDWIKFPLVLLIVSLISALSLTAVYSVTSVRKHENQAKLTQQSLKIVMPSGAKFKDVAIKSYKYKVAYDDKGRKIGYVGKGQFIGYSSIIKVMVGVDMAFTVQGIKILSQKETPGLGDKIEEVKSSKTWGKIISGDTVDESNVRPWFQEQFEGNMAEFRLKKNGGIIEGITGATISSNAVCVAVNNAVRDLKDAVNAK